ncbi:(d)CMP kinase [Amnibacterium flavum]|uniref:Cytidylate kinase n=1 Tax=Amnibacterium flavum TaxID=2173173 RepID=A0A2V1HQC6_9MICO|nr:(d)CMP kinase [Amnibacterium flavum]PVZ94816.1 (d)CMP kinase [Amnibacterium flavum]
MTDWTRTVVAVDGPAGSGKSSVSRAAARELGFAFLDTGAAYRALAWLALERAVDLDDADAVFGLLADWDYRISTDPDDVRVWVAGTEVTQAIRETRVSSVVSSVARVPAVREALGRHFRLTLDEPGAPGVIAEGRDITTVVAPDASVRVLLTASESVRLARRAGELGSVTREELARQVTERDRRDSQVVDFMTAADGVTTLDSSELDFDQTVRALVTIVKAPRN